MKDLAFQQDVYEAFRKSDERADRFEDSLRKLGILMEDMSGKFTLLLEGYQALDTKIDKKHEEFKEFREEVNYKFDIVFEKLDSKADRSELYALEKRLSLSMTSSDNPGAIQ